MEATFTLKGNEITINGLTWNEVKTWDRKGLDLRNLNQLLQTPEGQANLEQIILAHSSLTIEKLGAMQIDELLFVYDQILRATIEAAKTGIETVEKQMSGKNLFLIKGGKGNGR